MLKKATMAERKNTSARNVNHDLKKSWKKKT